jgi:hypothetical protein
MVKLVIGEFEFPFSVDLGTNVINIMNECLKFLNGEDYLLPQIISYFAVGWCNNVLIPHLRKVSKCTLQGCE